MLDFDSFNALHDEPSASNHAIRLETNLTGTEIAGSAVTANALILLRRAAETAGLKLTATGNLSWNGVAEMVDLFEWPDFDRADAFRLHKVVNEPDFLPLFFVSIALCAKAWLDGISGRPYGWVKTKRSADETPLVVA